MCIVSKEVWEEYLSFLFPLLFSLESQIPYLNYPDYQKRVFGFLAERIFTLYIARKQIYAKEYPILDTSKERILLRKWIDYTSIKNS